MSLLQKNATNRPLAPRGQSDNVVSFVNGLFVEMFAIAPAMRYQFKAEQELEATKQQWVMAFAENGIRTKSQTDIGLKALRANPSDFLPAVGKFIAWCNAGENALLGLPSEEELLKRVSDFMCYGMGEIHRFKFRNNAEYWLITDLYIRGRNQQWTDDELAKATGKALAKMAKRIKSGEPIPEPKITLPQKIERKLPQAEINRRWTALRKQLGG